MNIYEIFARVYIPSFDDSIFISFGTFGEREDAEAWVNDHEYTDEIFIIHESFRADLTA